MEPLSDTFLANRLKCRIPATGKAIPEKTFKELLATRRLLKTAARTALFDGGDRWLSNALAIEAVEIGQRALSLLCDTPEGKALYEDLCHTMVVELIGVTLYSEAIKLAEEALDAGMVPENSRVVSALDAAKLWNGNGWGRVRPSERKLRERKKRRWLWRNEKTKQPLRRVTQYRPSRKRMTYDLRELHRRINERGEKEMSL